MPLAILHPEPVSRVVGRRDMPRPATQPALRAPSPRLRLVAPLVVRAAPQPPRKRPAVPATSEPTLLRIVSPRLPEPVRFRLVPPGPAPRLVEPVAGVPVASAVGILGTPGTRVWMVPADLTLPGRVDITRFHVAIAAGVW